MPSQAKRRLLLLPGIDGTGQLFSPIVPLLENEFAIDIICYGNGRTFNTFKEHTDYVLSLIGNDKVTLLAESFSGPIALYILTNHANKIESCILSATFASSPYPNLCKLLSLLPTPILNWTQIQSLVLKLLCLNGVDLQASPNKELLEQTLQTIRSVPTQHIQKRLKLLSELTVQELTSDTPCLYLKAQTDRVISQTLTEQLVQALPNVIIKEIDGPHLLLQTKPQQCAAAIIDFLN